MELRVEAPRRSFMWQFHSHIFLWKGIQRVRKQVLFPLCIRHPLSKSLSRWDIDPLNTVLFVELNELPLKRMGCGGSVEHVRCVTTQKRLQVLELPGRVWEFAFEDTELVEEEFFTWRKS